MSLPTPASLANCDQGTDDPKQALLSDLASLIGKFNLLLAALVAEYAALAGNNNFTGTQTINGKAIITALSSFTTNGIITANASGLMVSNATKLADLAPKSHVGSASTDAAVGHPLATASSAGFMSAAHFATVQALGSGSSTYKGVPETYFDAGGVGQAYNVDWQRAAFQRIVATSSNNATVLTMTNVPTDKQAVLFLELVPYTVSGSFPVAKAITINGCCFANGNNFNLSGLVGPDYIANATYRVKIHKVPGNWRTAHTYMATVLTSQPVTYPWDIGGP